MKGYINWLSRMDLTLPVNQNILVIVKNEYLPWNPFSKMFQLEFWEISSDFSAVCMKIKLLKYLTNEWMQLLTECVMHELDHIYKDFSCDCFLGCNMYGILLLHQHGESWQHGSYWLMPCGVRGQAQEPQACGVLTHISRGEQLSLTWQPLTPHP